jgi:hypothetical protein
MADKKEVQVFKVRLKGVRLSFASIFKKKAFGDGEDGGSEPKFQAAFLIHKEKQDDQIRGVKDTIRKVAKAKWGENVPKLKADKFCMRDGDNEDYDGYAGHWYISASNAKRPLVVDRDKSALTEDDGRPYSGCFVNATVHIWAQDNKYGKRINASLEAVQFVKDGDAFGAPPVDVDEEFDDLGDDDAPASSSKGGKKSEEDDDGDSLL